MAAKRGRSGALDASELRRRAKGRLQRFRQSSLLAVAVTGLLLMFSSGGSTSDTMSTDADMDSGADFGLDAGLDAGFDAGMDTGAEAVASMEQATSTLMDLVSGFYSLLPKLAVAIIILLLGWLIAKMARRLTRRYFDGSQRAVSVVALGQIGIFFITFVIAVSVLVGDVRAFLGSLGLVGLALSWALQNPIESFTGWVLNTFRSHYRVGDRIAVGEVFGDVYKIDYLTTTVWEAGGPGKPVTGAQPTGAMITFPNSEILRANVVNYSRDFPYVWDEVTFGLANETDIPYALDVIRRKVDDVLTGQMYESALEYRVLLERQRLAYDIEDKPQVYLSLTDSWINCTIRYLVGVRERRRWSSYLVEEMLSELSSEKHKGRIRSAYPRQESLVYQMQDLPGTKSP